MKINTKIIKALKPCEDRLNNWLEHYESFNGDVSEFFKLTKITYKDKLWVALRLVDNDTKVIFALDCGFSAYAAYAAATYSSYAAYAAATYSSYAADYATYSADAADYATYSADAAVDAAADSSDQRLNERQNQLNILLYLMKGE